MKTTITKSDKQRTSSANITNNGPLSDSEAEKMLLRLFTWGRKGRDMKYYIKQQKVNCHMHMDQVGTGGSDLSFVFVYSERTFRLPPCSHPISVYQPYNNDSHLTYFCLLGERKTI